VADVQPALRTILGAVLAVRFPVEAVTWSVIGVLLFALLLAGWLWPGGMLRRGVRLLARSLFWLRVTGRENVPVRGPALVVCNRLNFLDCLLLLAVHRRPIRLVVAVGWATRSWSRRLLRWAGALVFDGSTGPQAAEETLRQAGAALARGELVGLFIESSETAAGAQLPFAHVLETILRHCPAPILPLWLDQVWGSLFNAYSGYFTWRWPQTVPYPVLATYGPPLPPTTPPGEVAQTVRRLGADTAIARRPQRRTVHRQFVRIAARHPFRTCFLDSTVPGGKLSYGRVAAGVLIARRLLRPRLGEGPLVAVWLPASAAAAVVNITLTVLGKTAVNLNYSTSAQAVQSALCQCKCRCVITSRRFVSRMPIDPGPDIKVIYLEDLQPLVGKGQRLFYYLLILLLPGFVLDRWVFGISRHGPEDLLTVIFSSGSTGEPKGIMLSQANVSANIESMIQATALGREDRALAVLPFFHSFGYTVTLWAPLQVGASATYYPDPRQAREIGELCRAHRCTIYLSTATFLRFCLKKCEPDDFRSLRFLVCGAEKLPQTLARDFQQKFGVLPLEGYGCTELSPVAATNLPDEDLGGVRKFYNRSGTVGQPIPGVAARVVHSETQEPLGIGEEGLLLMTGGSVMQGYLGRPDLTERVLLDGWYVTGDMARIDEEGFITLTGRLSRFAKVGGEMVPLERIEEELHEILGTSERVCAVTCVPDDTRGERLVVLYVSDGLAQHGLEVRNWWQQLNARGLPNLWVPSERDFFVVAEIPVLPTGKMDLARVKATALAIMKK
jgi:acyl-[acyl-carrier-protein]-phospholipid O-acyltransferase/long-chain-fatty-acid--[acyl-carrier-protein] ligase